MSNDSSSLRALDTILLGLIVVVFVLGPFEVAGVRVLPFVAFALSGTNAALANRRPEPRHWWRHVGFAGIWGLLGLEVLLDLGTVVYVVAALFGIACLGMSVRAARSADVDAA